MDLRDILEKKRVSQKANRTRDLYSRSKSYRIPSTKGRKSSSFGWWNDTYCGYKSPTIITSSGTVTWTISSPVTLVDKTQMDKLQKEYDELNEVNKHLVEKVAVKESNIKNLQDEVTRLEAELGEFKNVSAFFLSKYFFEVDNITPEDLEYGLLTLEKSILQCAENPSVDAYAWTEVYKLYSAYGEVGSHSPIQNVKIFIKNLVRKNHQLTAENTELKKLL